MDGESLERLMDVILQMRINLQHVTTTFQQQTLEIRQELAAIFEEKKRVLDGCLNGIDDKLKECAVHVEDYNRLYSSLNAMRQRLVQLGADPSPMPEPLPTEQLDGIVVWRLEQLKCQGKI